MVDFMKKLARMDVDMSAEERHLFSVGFKNTVSVKRASWRILSSLEQKVTMGEQAGGMINDYKKKVEDELRMVCNEILSIIAIHCLPLANTGKVTITVTWLNLALELKRRLLLTSHLWPISTPWLWPPLSFHPPTQSGLALRSISQSSFMRQLTLMRELVKLQNKHLMRLLLRLMPLVRRVTMTAHL